MAALFAAAATMAALAAVDPTRAVTWRAYSETAYRAARLIQKETTCRL